MVAYRKNVHDACMPTICCWNDTVYGSAQGYVQRSLPSTLNTIPNKTEH